MKNDAFFFTKAISPKRVRAKQPFTTQKEVLQQLSLLLAKQGQKEANIINSALVDRERLGSTAFPCGIAIPHASLESVYEPSIAFISLENGIHFSHTKNESTDLFCALILPKNHEQDYKGAIETLYQQFTHHGMLTQLRACTNDHKLYNTLLIDAVIE